MFRRELLVAVGVVSFICFWIYFEYWPVTSIEQWRAGIKTQRNQSVDFQNYEVFDHAAGETPFISVDFLRGKNFWNPQLAIWLEDLQGRHLQTLLVTTATAKGLFYAGRSAENFMMFDTLNAGKTSDTRQ
jgi:hypothetical protein